MKACKLSSFNKLLVDLQSTNIVLRNADVLLFISSTMGKFFFFFLKVRSGLYLCAGFCENACVDFFLFF